MTYKADKLFTAVDAFLQELEKATNIYFAGKKSSPPSGQNGKIAAIDAVLDFTRAAGMDRRSREVFYELLSDLDANNSNGKPSNETAKWATAAGAVDLLHECGVPVDQALGRVARATGTGQGSLTKATLKNYRKNIGSGRTSSATANDFRRQITQASKAYDLPKAEKIKRILEYIRAVFGN